MHKAFTHIFICVFILGSCTYLEAQSLKGFVKDTDGEQLVSASVILYAQDSTSLLSFTMTETDGSWKINDTEVKKNMVLSVSYLGYKDQLIKLDNEMLNKDNISITMKSDAVLDEVVIK